MRMLSRGRRIHLVAGAVVGDDEVDAAARRHVVEEVDGARYAARLEEDVGVVHEHLQHAHSAGISAVHSALQCTGISVHGMHCIG